MTTAPATKKSLFNRPEKPYVHPYLGGMILGIVLFLAFFLTFVPARTGTRDVRPDPDRTPVWWWMFHQVTVSVVNGLLLIPLWMVRERMPAEPMREWLFFGALAMFAISVVWRLGSAFFVGADFLGGEEILGPRRWLLVAVDALYSLILIVGALFVVSLKPSLAALLLAC